MSEPGLDYDFLRYIGYDPAAQREHQRTYLTFFCGCRRVVDLGCGIGDFVEMLAKQGIEAVGVDSDPTAVQHMRERGMPVVDQDVLAYLDELAPGSVDGIFASHLVEHLPYDRVLELARLAYRALSPGGVLVLATPDPRSLYAHLEMFYLHFGHVSFYHPRLLCFFLERNIDFSFAGKKADTLVDFHFLAGDHGGHDQENIFIVNRKVAFFERLLIEVS